MLIHRYLGKLFVQQSVKVVTQRAAKAVMSQLVNAFVMRYLLVPHAAIANKALTMMRLLKIASQ
jgi:hypothetical protein